MNADPAEVIQLPDSPSVAYRRVLLDVYDYLIAEFYDHENSTDTSDRAYALAQRLRDEILSS